MRKEILFWEVLILAALLLYLSRSYSVALYLFLPLYFFLVWHILEYEEHLLIRLTAISILTATSLAFRFDYLTGGDPWVDYGVAKHILATNRFPLKDEEPLARFIVVTVSRLLSVDPMPVQKFLIPAIGSLTVPVLYKFLLDFMPKRGALYGALLLSVTTPYLHWVTQGVRESLGLFALVFALYLSYEAVKTLNHKKFAIALLSIVLAVLSHPRAGFVFIASWVGFSSFYVASAPSRKRFMFGAVTTLFAIGFSLIWWEITSSKGMASIERFLRTYDMGLGGILLVAGVVTLALLKFTPVEFISRNRKPVYGLGLVGGVFALAYSLNFLGKTFALSYPLPYYANGAAMVSLSIAGLYYLLEKEKMPLIGWTLGVFTIFMLNLLFTPEKPTTHFDFPMRDPLRLTEFISIPLASVAGMGLLMLGRNVDKLLPAFLTLSLMMGLPSMVFLGTPFTKGHFLYDERSWLISHPEQEMTSVEWLGAYTTGSPIISDLYIRYSLFYIGQDQRAVLNRNFSGNGYKLITKRMNHITDFGETIFAERKPLTEEILRLEAENDKIYTNGYAHIYQ
jgi:hypothetical protein